MRRFVPTDVTRTPAAVKEFLKQGSVPSVSACVETLYRQQNAAGEI